MGFWICGVEIDRLAESRQPGIKIIFLIVDDAER